MGFIDNLYEIFGYKRDITNAPNSFVGFTTNGGLMASGVSTTTSLGLSAVWRSLDILSNGVSQLEWHERMGNLDLPNSRIVTRPQEERTRRDWVSLVVSTLALYDVAYLYKVRDTNGVVSSLVYLQPTLVIPQYTTDYLQMLPPATYMVGNDTVSKDELVIIHRGPQPGITEVAGGVINLARTAFASAIAAENYASRFWQSGGAPAVVLETDQVIPDTVANQISDRWAQRRAKGPDHAPVLTQGMHAKPFGADVSQVAAIEARREMVADIGRFFGIPTALLNAPAGDSETYASTESQGIDLVKYTLTNYINAIQDAISDELPDGRHMFMDTSPLTRTTHLARAQAWQLAILSGWMTANEVREAEGLAPLETPLPVLSTQTVGAHK